MQGNKAHIIYHNGLSFLVCYSCISFRSFISSLLFLYFVSAKLSNTESERGCGILHVYIYHCLVFVLYLSFVICCSRKRCICLMLYVVLERGNKERRCFSLHLLPDSLTFNRFACLDLPITSFLYNFGVSK